jgi:chemotaxis protein MotB
MFTSSRHKKQHSLDIWPGFVDAMATVLMVIVFVLMTFIVAQLCLTDALNDRDTQLASLNKTVSHLKNNLETQTRGKKEAEDKVTSIEKMLEKLQSQLNLLKSELSMQVVQKEEANLKSVSLSKQIIDLQQELYRLNQALETSQNTIKEKDIQTKNIKDDLNKLLLEKVEELKVLNDELLRLKDVNNVLQTDQNKNQKTLKINQYRSEFFTQLKNVLGDRNDIRVVGDRFVFQSEVLFEIASAKLGEQGQKKLDEIVRALKEITKKIPKDLPWILRIDGHTDVKPIKNVQFPSNWELSSARAIEVVKYLISKGIDPQHLVAAGFGEYQPLTDKTDDIAKNRRIEFKLDQH